LRSVRVCWRLDADVGYNSVMSALPEKRMNVDEFLAWAEGRPGRYELFRGEVYAMTPERAVHAQVKFAVQTALANGIRARGVSCHMLPDGMTVRIDNSTAHEPDALVYCGAKLAPHAIEVPNPVVVVEVLSPSTFQIDVAYKLANYFSLPSVGHYLVIDPNKPQVTHHARQNDGTILTRIVSNGVITLDLPGIELAIADIYPET
jgi:Uma2 family endonuclease